MMLALFLFYFLIFIYLLPTGYYSIKSIHTVNTAFIDFMHSYCDCATYQGILSSKDLPPHFIPTHTLHYTYIFMVLANKFYILFNNISFFHLHAI